MNDFFLCYLLWFLLGLFLGFLLFWLYDLLFRRNDDHYSQKTEPAYTATPEPTIAADVIEDVEAVSSNEHIEMSESSRDLAKSLGLKPQKSGRDDLTVIEGIGPKINQLLIAGGIETFRVLERTDTSVIQHILDEAGPSFRLAKPESWPLQAGLCVKQNWQELKEYQDRLFNGVEFDE